MVFQAEKLLKENEEELSSEILENLESATKTAAAAESTLDIKAALENLTAVLGQAGSSLYNKNSGEPELEPSVNDDQPCEDEEDIIDVEINPSS